MQAHARHFESALHAFDEDYRIYQCVLKHDAADISHRSSYSSPLVEFAIRERTRQLSSCSSISVYLVVLFARFRHPVTTWEKLKRFAVSRFSETLTGASMEEHILYARQELIRTVENLAAQMSPHAPMRILRKREAFQFFRRLVNLDRDIADAVRLKYDTCLARQIADSPIEAHRDYLRIGDHYARVLTLKDPPEETGANLLRPILESRSQCVIVSEWRRTPPDKIRKLIKQKKNHVLVLANIQMLRSVFLALVGRDKEADPEPDKAQKDAAARLDAALSAMENDGLTFGTASLSVVVYDTDPARLFHSVTQLYKALNELQVTCYHERMGLLQQYFAAIPGNDRFNRRYLYLSSRNHSHFSFLFLPQPGEETNGRLNDEYLIALATRQNTPYRVNLHCGDSPHAFICGVNGSGKSFLANALVTHAQKYDPYTLLLDLGGSYREITERFGGSYLEMDPGQMRVRINPFCLPPKNANLHFLYSFVRVLIESGEYRMTDEDKRDLFQRIKAIYQLAPQDRTLGMLYMMSRNNIRVHLARWVRKDDRQRSGQYGELFDNHTDTLTLARFQCLDFQGVEDVPEIAEPLLFYVLHRSRATVYDPENASTFKLVLADEAWRFLTTDITRNYIVSALKTWRKHNGGFWFITQSPNDLIAAKVERVLAEAQTSVLLANPRLDEDVYRSLFKLNETEIREVKALQQKREVLIKQPQLSKIVRLDASPEEINLYSSTPQREQEKRKIA
jgi:type IV secretion system protein VirB4